jgi:anti-sigma factor RsiW
MGEHRLTTLIDQYLLGTISPEDRSQLEQLILSDPAVSKLVRESEAAFKVLQHEKKRRLKEKLRGLDRDEMMHQGLFSKPIGWLTIILLAGIAGVYLLAGHYSHASIAIRNVEPYPTRTSITTDAPEDAAAWAKAQSAFLARDFDTAIQSYQTLSEHPDGTKAYVAKWNILLAQLALEGPTPTWKMSLDTFTKSAPEPLRSKAFRLSGLLDSMIYRLFQNQLQERFSTLKPRLI